MILIENKGVDKFNPFCYNIITKRKGEKQNGRENKTNNEKS